MNSQNIPNRILLTLVVLWCVICLSEQQFSYSANWGKRTFEKNAESNCIELMRFKENLVEAIPNLEAEIIVKLIDFYFICL